MTAKTETKRKFEPGQRVWKFDQNHRIYHKDERGHATGSPIFAEYYRPYWVVEVKDRTYLIGYGATLDEAAKRQIWPGEIGIRNAEKSYSTDAEKEDATYKHDHTHRIVEMVRDADAATLRRVAEVLGYQEQE